MNDMDRRTFLKRSAAASVMLGFPLLSRFAEAEPCTDKPAVLKEALARMKDEHKPGVALLFPNDAGMQNKLGRDLEELLSEDKAGVKQLFCEAVFVCLRPTDAATHFTQHKSQGAAVCLNPDGDVVDTWVIEPWQFRERFVAEIGALVHGKNGERSRQWADAQRKTIGDQTSSRLDRALKQLGAERPSDRDAAQKELAEVAPKATSVLGLARIQTDDPEVRHRIDAVFTGLFAGAAKDKASVRLPYGVEWAEGSLGCGGRCSIAEREVAVACGIARVAPASRKYLRFVTEARR